MTEAQALIKLRGVYSLVSNPVTVSEDTDLQITKRSLKVVIADNTGTAPVADIKFLEWYAYKLGLAQEAVYLTKTSGVELVDDILSKVTG